MLSSRRFLTKPHITIFKKSAHVVDSTMPTSGMCMGIGLGLVENVQRKGD